VSISADHLKAKGDGAFVLVVSDRPSERNALERAISFVIDCRTSAPEATELLGQPVFALLDLAPPVLKTWSKRLDERAPPIPRLALVRGEPLTSGELTQFLPAGAPRPVVLSHAFAMIEAATRAASIRAQRLRDKARAAKILIADIFDSAALGGSLDLAELEQGTETVLSAVSEGGISAWLAELWRHDAGVYEHTLSVAGYCAAFGARIGFSRLDLTRLAKAALLHDIGKSRIPKSILDKPGRLDANEDRLMRRHPEIGAGLLTKQGGFEPAVVDVVLHHHERLDGTGYPDRLSGRQIADLVRIVSICDVFSALTERRSYRKSATPAEALAIMVKTPGHLDADLLAAFAPAMLACEPLAP
jgi:putative nucleotidyltransferase with HDIG domain